ncbi:MAG: hypothetical protein ACJ72W_02155 [Actinoallomurus sp.]
MPGVRYTIQTSRDDVVTPYSSAFLTGPHVTNSRTLVDLRAFVLGGPA